MPTCSPARSQTLDLRAASTDESRVLIVRHGRNRGPAIRLRRFRQAYCEPLFEDMSLRWPSLFSKLRFWETGQPEPNLDAVVAIVFLLQDPLQERYPDCYQDSLQLAESARLHGIRLVNPPEALSNSAKTRQANIWREAGLPTPPCHTFDSVARLHSLAAEIDAPMVLRSEFDHAQTRTHVAKSFDELKAIDIDEIAFPGSLSPLVDTRCGYQATNANSPFATHYHKKRAMVFGDRVQNNHVFFSTQPIVGCVSSTFGHYRSLNPIRRMIGNRQCRQHIECDIDYHHAECEDSSLLVRAAKSLGFEFCAIDYASHADGRIELWEANPHFSLHLWPRDVLGRQRKLAVRTPRIHDTAARFFGDLLGVAV